MDCVSSGSLQSGLLTPARVRSLPSFTFPPLFSIYAPRDGPVSTNKQLNNILVCFVLVAFSSRGNHFFQSLALKL